MRHSYTNSPAYRALKREQGQRQKEGIRFAVFETLGLTNTTLQVMRNLDQTLVDGIVSIAEITTLGLTHNTDRRIK